MRVLLQPWIDAFDVKYVCTGKADNVSAALNVFDANRTRQRLRRLLVILLENERNNEVLHHVFCLLQLRFDVVILLFDVVVVVVELAHRILVGRIVELIQLLIKAQFAEAITADDAEGPAVLAEVLDFDFVCFHVFGPTKMRFFEWIWSAADCLRETE